MSIQVSPSPIPNSSTVNLSSALLHKDTYLSDLSKKVRAVKGYETFSQKDFAWVEKLRDHATDWVCHSTIPTTRDEEWRFTDLSALKQVQFDYHLEKRNLASLQKNILPEASESHLMIVNGVYAPELSSISNFHTEGVFVGNFASLPAEYIEKAKEYLGQSEGAMEVFTALNTAGMIDVDIAVVWISKNVVVETPINLVYATTDDNPVISQPRCLVVVESGSKVTIVEEFTNHRDTERTEEEGKSGYFANAVTEIWISDNASVNHTRVQRDSNEAFHVGKTAVTQARCSRYTCHAITLGAKLSRHNLEILQTGEQTETTLNGLTIISGKQLSDTHSAIALNYPHGTSKQLHKCIVGDRAHAVFNGKVLVPKLAQLTNAVQMNRNLLLSSKARVDTKPQLEITADNVKCAHGATVSQLEDDEIFYLQSRGIDENDARKLLINAFAAEIINQIPVPSLQEILLNTVNNLKSLTNE